MDLKNLPPVSFLADLAKEAGQTISLTQWRESFSKNYELTEMEPVRLGDEAFFALLELNDHAFLADIIVNNAARFFRPQKVQAFITGKTHDKQYTPAPRELAEKVGQAVATLLLPKVQRAILKYGEVPDSFWETDATKPGYNLETAKAATEIASDRKSVV